MLHAKNYRQLTRLFFCFVLPSVGAQLLSGIYTIVDGFFVGMGTGEEGLAAVGLAYPFTVFVTAVGAGIGVGGGALLSISMGRGREKLAERVLGSMVFLIICASLITSLGFSAASKTLLSLYDVSVKVAEMSYVYAWILLIGSPAQIFTMGFLGAVRNDGYPRKAMYIMISGFVANIILDWLLVIIFPFGVAGAAWATVASQLLTGVLLTLHFLSGHSTVRLNNIYIKLCLPVCKKIVTMGSSPFGVQVAAALTMIMHNWQSLVYGGDIGVAAYAVVGYIVPVGVMLQEGIAEGIQPLISYYYGANLSVRRRLTARMGFSSALAVGVICSILIFMTRTLVPSFFSMEGKAAQIAVRGLLLSVPMFPFLGLAKVGASYFQSIGRVKLASGLTYADPLILLPIFLWVLPSFWGLDGVWLAMPFANMALCITFIIMWKKEPYIKMPLVTLTWI
jgi:putative MATE family efflux protein